MDIGFFNRMPYYLITDNSPKKKYAIMMNYIFDRFKNSVRLHNIIKGQISPFSIYIADLCRYNVRNLCIFVIWPASKLSRGMADVFAHVSLYVPLIIPLDWTGLEVKSKYSRLMWTYFFFFVSIVMGMSFYLCNWINGMAIGGSS